jgi:hypothetical protein
MMGKHLDIRRNYLFRIVAGVCVCIFVMGVLLMVKNFFFPKKYLSKILYQSPYQTEVGDAILKMVEEKPEGETLEPARLTPFSWDRVCIFGELKSFSEINRALDIAWLDGTGYVQDFGQLFVFAKDREVVQHLYFSPAVIMSRNELRRRELCLSADEAVFIVGGYDWHDMRLKRLLLPEKFFII